LVRSAPGLPGAPREIATVRRRCIWRWCWCSGSLWARYRGREGGRLSVPGASAGV